MLLCIIQMLLSQVFLEPLGPTGRDHRKSGAATPRDATSFGQRYGACHAVSASVYPQVQRLRRQARPSWSDGRCSSGRAPSCLPRSSITAAPPRRDWRRRQSTSASSSCSARCSATSARCPRTACTAPGRCGTGREDTLLVSAPKLSNFCTVLSSECINCGRL